VIGSRKSSPVWHESPKLVALQLVIEDDAPEVPPALANALGGAFVRPVNQRIVRQLARLHEAIVERLWVASIVDTPRVE